MFFPFLGGKKILQKVGGKDASKQFWKYHNEAILKKYKSSLQVGSLDSKKKVEEPAKPDPAVAAPKATPAASKAVTKNANQDETEALEAYGDQIPFGDPSWYQNVSCKSNYILKIILTDSFPPVPLSLLQRVACRSASRDPRVDRGRDRTQCYRVGREEGGAS